MKHLSFEEFKKHSDQPLKVPLYVQVSSDLVSPIRAYYALREHHEKGFLLESREHVQAVGRYSFVGFDPVVTVEVYGEQVNVQRGQRKETIIGPYKEVLRKILQDNKIVSHLQLPPLAGGAVGYYSYDAVRLSEKLPDRHENTHHIPDVYFGFYQTTLVFDHLYQLMTLVYVPEKTEDVRRDYEKGMEHLKKVLGHVLSYSRQVQINFSELENPSDPKYETDCSDGEYHKIVKTCKEHILAGDIFQVVPSRSFFKKITCDPLDVFRLLRVINPSPFMFYLNHQDYIITGSSPERFAALKEGWMETMPIAGTISRGLGAQDEINERLLLSDEKEVAEHMMLIDLARNDLGSLALPGSVEVHDKLSIQRLSHVMHITSRVLGRIQANHDAFDMMQAFLPAGTLSGAPKIRAMEIIDELEKSRRGIYGGAICYIDNMGQLDSCIAIRSAFIKDGIAQVRAGAGVVYDSLPENEAQETINKAKVVLEAIEHANRGGLC